MWLLYAVGSALFAGLTSVLANAAFAKTDSAGAAIRTIIVLILRKVHGVCMVSSQGTIASIPARSLVSWGCRVWLVPAGCAIFMPCSAGRSIRSLPIDKSSTVMTILLAALLLGECDLDQGHRRCADLAGTF